MNTTNLEPTAAELEKAAEHLLDLAGETYQYMDDPEYIAATMGMTALFPAANELQLDIDDDLSWQHFLKVRYLLEQEGVLVRGSTQVLASKSGNRHVIVRTTEVHSMAERIALQAAMGSDRVREMFNTLRYINGMDQPVCLFRPMTKEDSAAFWAASPQCEIEDELPF